METKISRVMAREILDSRGNPTIEATVVLEDGAYGTASAPSGASTGKYEAHELRDGNKHRYGGKGVAKAVINVNKDIADAIEGMPCDFWRVDKKLISLDGTENKARLGANAILAVSLASAKAAANHYKMPLYRYLGGASARVIPIPLMNILNGGAHASNSVDIQEFMIMPVKFQNYYEALRAGVEIYHQLGKLLAGEGHSTTVGDEGGFAPNLSTADEAIEYILRAVKSAGYSEDSIKIALDVASSEWAEGEKYVLPKSGRVYTSESLISEYERLCGEYPIVSIEDGLGEDDHEGWVELTARLRGKCLLVGDDYFVTNPKKLMDGIKRCAGSAVLVKPNQIGTLSETLEVIRMARVNGYRAILSHRSGETPDTTIADIAVATGAGFIKTGAPCRGERLAKYNRLLRIEAELGGRAVYGEN